MGAVIRFEEVTKRYRLGVERSNLRRAIPWIPTRETAGEGTVTAVDRFNLEVEEGESVGIIGANGTGKSTLLKLVAGVVAPTAGRVMTRGRIASVIELGVGFHNDLTGRENLEFTGALMGVSKAEIRRREDDIVDFAGIGWAMDTPVKRYSSGMLARLGFAIATHVDADVVLVDEVLSVGDIDFQRLSLERLENLIFDGVTTLFVSHNLAAIAHLCDRVMRLDKGRVVADGEPEQVLKAYGGSMAQAISGLGKVPVRLRSLRIRPQEVEPGDPFDIEAYIEVDRPMPKARLRLVLRPTAEMALQYGNPEDLQDVNLDEIELVELLNVPVPSEFLTDPGKWRLRGKVSRFPMFAGTYMFSLDLLEEPHYQVLDSASALIRVPGVAEAPTVSLPVTWNVEAHETRSLLEKTEPA